MTTIVRSTPVDAQPLVQPHSSLLDIARVIDQDNLYYQAGDGVLRSLACTAPRTAPFCPTPHGTKTLAGVTWAKAVPFAVYMGIGCNPVGLGYDTIAADLAEVFQAGESRGVEANVETLLLSASPTDVGGATPLQVGDAMGRLEHWYNSQSVGLGVLHIPVGLVAQAQSTMAIRLVGDQWETAIGTPVVVGTGYTGGQPAIPTTPTSALWITGPITILRGPLSQGTGFDTTTNSAVALAERPYIAVNEGCAVGKAVASTTCCGGP